MTGLRHFLFAACAVGLHASALSAQTGWRSAGTLMDATALRQNDDLRVLCDGQQRNALQVLKSGLSGLDEKGLTTVQKFGFVTPPDNIGRAILFRTQPNNLPVGGAPRCEAGWVRTDQGLPRETEFWHATRMWIEDWSTARDDMLILQWYHGMPGANLNPPFGIVLSGPKLTAEVRSSSATRAKQHEVAPQRMVSMSSAGLYGRWLDVVIHARISQTENLGFLKLYLDDHLVGEHRGAIGYAQDGAVELPRVGIYPLIKKLPFDPALPVRKLYVKRSLVLKDADAKMTLPSVRALIQAPD